MSLKDRLSTEMKQALKNKEKVKLSTIRMINAAIINKEKEKRRSLEEREVVQVIQSLVKQLEESMVHFKSAQREELVKKSEEELEVLKSFLPKPLTSEELEIKIKEIIEKVNAVSIRDLGKVMKALMEEVGDRVNGKVASEKVKKMLSA
ncbi:MAG: GatB/YqeY domain-containing protein [Deltaproteobacteria bacterium]|nr:GatB/YqeY domain-containing protein [Deltaproteobacteria bacterium]RLA89526.1 MAG: GatB/YqeY domain-containing protein [Deltaproteobacteria bacterium]